MNSHGSSKHQEANLGNVRERRMVLDLDLNNPPLGENSAQSNPPEFPGQGNGMSLGQTSTVIEIDDDDDNDDVEVISPRNFDEATRNSRRNQGVFESFESFESFEGWLILNEAEQRFPGVPFMDLFEIANGRPMPQIPNAADSHQEAPPTSPSPPSAFSCGICMEPLVEETSTKCGHIFCKRCIDVAILTQRKCPTCRQKLNRRDTIRIYLPRSC